MKKKDKKRNTGYNKHQLSTYLAGGYLGNLAFVKADNNLDKWEVGSGKPIINKKGQVYSMGKIPLGKMTRADLAKAGFGKKGRNSLSLRAGAALTGGFLVNTMANPFFTFKRKTDTKQQTRTKNWARKAALATGALGLTYSAHKIPKYFKSTVLQDAGIGLNTKRKQNAALLGLGTGITLGSAGVGSSAGATLAGRYNYVENKANKARKYRWYDYL